MANIDKAFAFLHQSFSRLRVLFYVASVKESSFPKVELVPDYVNEAVPWFIILIILEFTISHAKGKGRLYSWNDSVGSISAGIISQLVKVLHHGVEIAVYAWIYKNYRWVELDWSAASTWWLCFIGVDFGYYWFHRMGHEVNFIWATHQTHHSSEYYNLSTALRQGALQQYFSWVFYLPLALGVPPSVFLVHMQFNLLYQFWIHTQLIKSIGPLEYILNTPSHHRVHHGRNRYCIDKNYGATLIIWDRIFGTFEAENEEIVYGLVHPVANFNPIDIQSCHYIYILKTFWNTSGFVNKLSVFFKGPGWTPGQPRLGNIDDIPEIHAPIQPYGQFLPSWCNVYLVIHFILIIIGYQEIVFRQMGMSSLMVVCFASYVLLSLTSIGLLFDVHPLGPILEVTRCIIFIPFNYYIASSNAQIHILHAILQLFFILSATFWAVNYLQKFKLLIKDGDKKTQ